MQIVTLYGGLGNQLFQLSTAMSICAGEIIVDTSLMGTYAKKRSNNLDQILKLPDNVIFARSKLATLRLPKLLNNSYFVSDNTCHEKASRPTVIKIFDGYFQNGKTVSFYDQVRSIKPSLIRRENFPYAEKSCVVHIRGDDFFTTNSPLLPTDYYHLKINEMQDKGVKNFVVATDDLDYAKKIMEAADCSYSISMGGVVNDFYLIMQSKYKILSNSTFSIWANALGDGNAFVLRDEGFYDQFDS